MKTEEFLESYAISDLDVFGRHEEHYSLDNLLNEYARIQIEKDRKRIKEAYYSDTDFGDFNNLLKSTKINLD